MIKESNSTLRIKPESSVRLSLFIYGTHFTALAVTLFLPIALQLQLAILILIAISLIHALRTHVLRTNGYAIQSAEWDGGGEWTLFMASGKRVPAQLRASSYVQPWLVVLNFSTGRFSTNSLILVPDAIDPDLLRRLRVRLRLSGSCGL